MYKVLGIKYFKKIFLPLLIVTCYLLAPRSLGEVGLLVTAPLAQAQTMSNQNYIIQTEEINTISDTATNVNYNSLQTAADKPNPNVSEGVNFKIKTGFENLVSVSPFSISLSSDIVDFGALSPTNPIIRTADLSVNSKTAYGYSVIVFENEPLTTIFPNDKAFIPDTTCDNGRCDIQNASEWINPLTYGFGYRCDNLNDTDCDSSFTSPNSYKHFPDIANNDDPQSIMAGIGANNKTARISYKINISGTQTQGAYNNVITYIAIPNF